MATKTLDQQLELSDMLEALHTKCVQLEALMANTMGECGRSFRNMNDELQDNYLWTCTDMVSAMKSNVAKAQQLEITARRAA